MHFILESGIATDWVSLIVHRGLISLTVLSVSAVVMESVPAYRMRYGTVFLAIELLAVAVFSVEYILRLWSAPDYPPYAGLGPWAARAAFVVTGSAIIDLASTLPLYVAFFTTADLRILLLFRLFRFFKLARYSPGMRSLLAALQAERKALFASAIILLGLVLIAASAMHAAEHDVQPDKFGSIPEAMWWAVVTLTTVGYGDVVPVTLVGRMIAGLTMIFGLMMLALPIGIIATAFANEIHRRDFVVNWAMIARVPLFASLDASEIAEIMPYLRAQTVQSGAMIVRRGEAAQSMYFIASGEVEVVLPTGNIRLGDGHFFGEMAVLRQTRRTADIKATQPTKLLVLDASDFHALVERNPDIGARVHEVADRRMDTNNNESGDLAKGEMGMSDAIDPPP